MELSWKGLGPCPRNEARPRDAPIAGRMPSGNGFASDAFADPSAGVALVRREIQRLCPDGCKRVLYFEDKTLGSSVYEKAIQAELDTGLLGAVSRAANAADLTRQLRRAWDLLVYAHQGGDGPEPYDGQLAERICGGQRAILTAPPRPV